MGCCGSVIKYLLFIFNFFFVLCGIALIAVGAVLLTDVADFPEVAEYLDTSIRAPQITLIVVGTFIFFTAFLGCCGAIKENRCMLITFGVILLVLFIIQLAIGIYAAVNFKDTTVESNLQKIFDKHTADSQNMINDLQTALKCCGVKDSTDYGFPSSVPQSCCDGECRDSNFYKIGCAEALTDWAVDAGAVLAGVAIGLGLVEIIGVIFAFYHAKHVNELL